MESRTTTAEILRKIKKRSTPLFATAESENAEKVAAEAAAASVSATPRTYELEGMRTPGKLRVLFLGCFGSNNESQIETMSAIDRLIATHPEEKPDIIILLGDMMYKAKTLSHHEFLKRFYPYFDAEYFPAIKGIPLFPVLGNHELDVCFSSWATEGAIPSWMKEPTSREGLLTRVIAETYRYQPGDPDNTTPAQKKELFSGDKLNIRKLSKFNMPASHYALTAGEVQLNILDSNELVPSAAAPEYSITSRHNTGQAAWLLAAVNGAKSVNRRHYICSHHPDNFFAARSEMGEAEYYCHGSLEGINRAQGNPTDNNDLGLIQRKFFAPIMASIKGKFAAHEHGLSQFVNQGTYHVTSAGGGGTLEQPLTSAIFRADFYAKQHGFTIVEFDTQGLVDDLISHHSLDGRVYRFSGHNPAPLHAPEDDHKVTLLREIVINACVDFFRPTDIPKSRSWSDRFLHACASVTPVLVKKGVGKVVQTITTPAMANKVDPVLEILNYLRQYRVFSFAETVAELHTLTKKLLPEGEPDHPLLMIINGILRANLTLGEKSLGDLYNALFPDVSATSAYALAR